MSINIANKCTPTTPQPLFQPPSPTEHLLLFRTQERTHPFRLGPSPFLSLKIRLLLFKQLLQSFLSFSTERRRIRRHSRQSSGTIVIIRTIRGRSSLTFRRAWRGVCAGRRWWKTRRDAISFLIRITVPPRTPTPTSRPFPIAHNVTRITAAPVPSSPVVRIVVRFIRPRPNPHRSPISLPLYTHARASPVSVVRVGAKRSTSAAGTGVDVTAMAVSAIVVISRARRW
jgi:hypothetical protein